MRRRHRTASVVVEAYIHWHVSTSGPCAREFSIRCIQAAFIVRGRRIEPSPAKPRSCQDDISSMPSVFVSTMLSMRSAVMRTQICWRLKDLCIDYRLFTSCREASVVCDRRGCRHWRRVHLCPASQPSCRRIEVLIMHTSCKPTVLRSQDGAHSDTNQRTNKRMSIRPAGDAAVTFRRSLPWKVPWLSS